MLGGVVGVLTSHKGQGDLEREPQGEGHLQEVWRGLGRLQVLVCDSTGEGDSVRRSYGSGRTRHYSPRDRENLQL